MSRKFYSPFILFCIAVPPARSPTYWYGITVKGLFSCRVCDQELSRGHSVLYP
jgi:hypothetical protein